MKTPETWLNRIAEAVGQDVFIQSGQKPGSCTEKIISEIQRDAREGMVPVEDVRPLLEAVNAEANNNDELVTLRGWIMIERCLVTLRDKHPHLFTK